MTAAPPERHTVEFMTWLATELAWTVIQGAMLAAVAWFVGQSFGADSAYVSVWAVCVVAVLALRLQRLALPRRRRTRKTPVADHREARVIARLTGMYGGHNDPELMWVKPLPETLEHRFRRMYRHVDRVTYAVAAPRHYDAGVRPVLTDIARDRLRRFHGIDVAAEPDRARVLLGDDLWNALMTPLTTAPKERDIDRWLSRLEGLGPPMSSPAGSSVPGTDPT